MAEDGLPVFYDSAAALQSARLRQLHAQWEGGCAGATFPALAAIDPVELKQFLTDLVVVDVRDPDHPKFRLFGSGYREFFSQDFSGTEVRAAPFPEADAIAAIYREVALSGAPRCGWYRWQSEHGVSHISEFVVLPYGDQGKVERLLVMEDLDRARQGASPGGSRR
ncbi:MAG: PAS domain-containing protein [Rhodospirillaceae bacterium]|nr:PAS domain-containing protein [Rhodospirillaceae bacterium]